jgi:hypothetical protein
MAVPLGQLNSPPQIRILNRLLPQIPNGQLFVRVIMIVLFHSTIDLPFVLDILERELFTRTFQGRES